MRWVWVAAGALAALILAVFLYAFFSLNAIIKANQQRLLARVGAALGRPVTVAKIRATLGWGLGVDLENLTVADDPAFSAAPFAVVRKIHARVELLPLLFRAVRLESFRLTQPEFNVIRHPDGRFNFDSLGAHGPPRAPIHSTPRSPGPPSPPSAIALPSSAGRAPVELTALSVGTFAVRDGRIHYRDLPAPPVEVTDLDLDAKGVRADRPFTISATLSALGSARDVTLSGTVGPLLRDGRLDPDHLPFDLKTTLGPVTLAQLAALPHVAAILPAGLEVTNPLTLTATLHGDLRAFAFTSRGDFTANHLVYRDLLDKPAGFTAAIDLAGSREGRQIRLAAATLALGTLRARAADVLLTPARLTAMIDCDHCDLANLAAAIPRLRPYHPAGQATFHGTLTLAQAQPALDGTLDLVKVSATLPDSKLPPVTNLTGPVAIAATTARIGPLNLDLGASPITVTAEAISLAPLRGRYQVRSATLNLGDLIPGRRQSGDQIRMLAANGDFRREGDALVLNATASSTAGTIFNVAYQNLTTAAAYDAGRLTLAALNFAAFAGTVGVAGEALTGAAPNFALTLTAHHIDLQQALASQQAKAADNLRGILTGTLRVTGHGTDFARIRPTLRGDGNAVLTDGRLVGTNLVAEALKKLDNLPAIGALVPPAVVARHPELFQSPDTVIDEASLTFTLHGPRLISHDLRAAAPDYSILGDGWFDMDKNLDLAARILLAPPFSAELAAARPPVAYLENGRGEVEVPLRVSGRLPHPQVVPDVGTLTARIGSHAFANTVGKLLNKGEGSLGNPLNRLKGLFH